MIPVAGVASPKQEPKLKPVTSEHSDDEEDLWSSEEDDRTDDYDYRAPFNGQQETTAENDLMPRTFENLAQKKKDTVKKPHDETSRTPNAPW